jgi:hypothetical protein
MEEVVCGRGVDLGIEGGWAAIKGWRERKPSFLDPTLKPGLKDGKKDRRRQGTKGYSLQYLLRAVSLQFLKANKQKSSFPVKMTSSHYGKA